MSIKSINVDCQNAYFFLPVRCAASYFKRWSCRKTSGVIFHTKKWLLQLHTVIFTVQRDAEIKKQAYFVG